MHSLKTSQTILCRYTNPTSRIQIIKITNISSCHFERAIVPYGTVLFEADRTAHLEIHTSEMIRAILSDVIPCIQLTTKAHMSVDKGPQERGQKRQRVAQTAPLQQPFYLQG